jgi:asparagine synthase (glutamine-hydrolysing)
MRRLAIIDIDGGQQPISSADGRYHLICNGEIYNYKSLRNTAEHLGYHFRSQSDIEVIIPLITYFGTDGLKMLDGMFALALWDSKEESLLLARDRIGIKPLFYSTKDRSIVFASELRALSKSPLYDNQIDLISLNQYLSFDYVPSPRTILKGVSRLEPGEFLFFCKGLIKKARYWNISFTQSESRPPLNPDDYYNQFIRILTSVVSRELQSDVPIGVFLSGGLDSSAVAAIAQRVSDRTIKTFSVALDDPSFDESSWARLISERIGTEHFEYRLTTDEIIQTIMKLGELIDEPLADSSFIPTYVLSKFARTKVKVALGGDGGDELFAGYPTYQAHQLVDLYEMLVPRLIRTRIMPSLTKALPVSFRNVSTDFKIKRFLGGRGVPFMIRHHRWLGSFDDEQKRLLFHRNLELSNLDTYEPVFQKIRESDATSRMNQALFADMKFYLEGDILSKVDRASMANSLEVRVPLLNKEIVDFVTALPFDFKMRGFTTKYFFKRSLRGILPRNVIHRSKKGFNIPIAEFLTRELKDLTLQLLGREAIEKQGLFNHAYIQSLIDDHMNRKADRRKELWNLIVFQIWYNKNCSHLRHLTNSS